MDRRNEHGVALVITLFLMAALSALAVSLMFLSQTETSASRNYKTMSQARYAGEAGVHKAMNYLMSDAYTTTLAGTYGSLTTGVYPVQWNGADVVLNPSTGTPAYPNSTVRAAYLAMFSGTANDLPAGTANLKYTATAKLLSMQPVNVYGSNTKYIQTWQITSTGTVQGPLPATVDVTAILERDIAPAQTYAVFATGNGCGAINLSGTSHTDSYDSRSLAGSPPAPVIANSGGGVGTNGNLSITGHVQVNGNLDTPRTGVGDCHAGTPTALSEGGSADVSGTIVPLPQERVFTTPDPPTVPTTALAVDASAAWCTTFMADPAVLLAVATCTVPSSNNVVITMRDATPLALGNVSLGSQTNMTIIAGTGGVANVNVNSLSLTAQAKITMDASTSIVMNVLGQGVATPVDLGGNGFVNSTYDASKFQILYGGTGNIELIGGGAAAISVYAPNAAVRLNGNADLYGSVLSKTYTNGGNGSVHYDRALQSKFFMLGNWVMSSFSWKKY